MFEQAAGLDSAPALARGGVFLVPAGTSLRLSADAGGGPLLVWGCAVNSRVYAPAVPAGAERLPADQVQPAELVAAA